MKILIIVLTAALSILPNSTFAQQCNPTAKVYCSCETISHSSFYGISIVRLDLISGVRSVLTRLKPYNNDPILQPDRPGDLEKCRALMQNYDECRAF